MPGPVQTCETCGLVEPVKMDGRGFPPDIAKRRLAKKCAAAGHESKPRYTAGYDAGVARLLGGAS